MLSEPTNTNICSLLPFLLPYLWGRSSNQNTYFAECRVGKFDVGLSPAPASTPSQGNAGEPAVSTSNRNSEEHASERTGAKNLHRASGQAADCIRGCAGPLANSTEGCQRSPCSPKVSRQGGQYRPPLHGGL